MFVIFVNEYVNNFQTLSELCLKHSKFHYDIAIIYLKGDDQKKTLEGLYTSVFPMTNFYKKIIRVSISILELYLFF